MPIYANIGLLRERVVTVGGNAKSIGLRIKAEELQRQSQLHLSAAPQQVLPGVWTTGVVATRTEAEGRGTNHVVRAADGTSYVPDPYEDDLSLVIERPQGWVLVCGCCHAGLLNTLAHVRQVFGVQPTVVIGGTHLVTADPAQLSHVVEVLRTMGPPMFHLNHCTGPVGLLALSTTFGRRVAPFPAGATLEL
jgi:7,8-dihydropterin-6-yl-methyl-4-(beta-D-ribofuranosyl)aminobenzene 5'-phosphate synthase